MTTKLIQRGKPFSAISRPPGEGYSRNASCAPNLISTFYHICITNDHRYVPFVVSSSRSFPYLTLPEHMSSSSVFSWIRSLVFCVRFYRSLFVLLAMAFMSFFYLQLLVTPLVSSNFLIRVSRLPICNVMSGGGSCDASLERRRRHSLIGVTCPNMGAHESLMFLGFIKIHSYYY
jgi:hypothetical protein